MIHIPSFSSLLSRPLILKHQHCMTHMAAFYPSQVQRKLNLEESRIPFRSQDQTSMWLCAIINYWIKLKKDRAANTIIIFIHHCSGIQALPHLQALVLKTAVSNKTDNEVSVDISVVLLTSPQWEMWEEWMTYTVNHTQFTCIQKATYNEVY